MLEVCSFQILVNLLNDNEIGKKFIEDESMYN